MLRVVLGRYRGVPPESISFCYGPYGKPILRQAPDEFPLEFNVTHSGGLAVYAVAHGRKVGVDLEHLRPTSQAERVVEHFMSYDERAALNGLPESKRQEALLGLWTRKEACAKATGRGLSLPLSAVVSSPLDTNLTVTQGDGEAAESWSVIELDVADGYAAHLAVEGGTPWRLRQRWLQ